MSAEVKKDMTSGPLSDDVRVEPSPFIESTPNSSRTRPAIKPSRLSSTLALSLWKDVESLRHFTWNTIHKRFRLRTREWFEPPEAAYLVCWPIEEGRRPTGEEALEKLEELRRDGPSDRIFGTEALMGEAA